GGRLLSDCDPELLVHLSFTDQVTIASVDIGIADEDKAPSHVYVVANSHLSFEDFEAGVDVGKGVVEAVTPKYVKQGKYQWMHIAIPRQSTRHFQAISKLTVFCPESNDEEYTEIAQIKVFGTAEKGLDWSNGFNCNS
ncbi:hypothetical protein KIPB_009563, partial [Kipferlia bialata]